MLFFAFAWCWLLAAGVAGHAEKKEDRGKPGTTIRENWCSSRYIECSDQADDSCRKVHGDDATSLLRCQKDGLASCGRIWGAQSDCSTRARIREQLQLQNAPPIRDAPVRTNPTRPPAEPSSGKVIRRKIDAR